MHESGAGVARIVQADLRNVEITNSGLPHRAQRRRVIRFAGLVTHDEPLIGVSLTEHQLFSGLTARRRHEFGQKSIRDRQHAPGVGRLGLVLVERPAADVERV